MPIRGLRVKKYTPNMAMFGDFDRTEAHFLAPYYQYRPDSFHHPGCVIDKNISLSMVKWA